MLGDQGCLAKKKYICFMMTHESTEQEKNDGRDPSRASPISFSSNEVESEETEISEASLDSNSDSDQEDFDKNNNLTPATQDIFPRHSGLGKFHFSTRGYGGNDSVDEDMASSECDDPLRQSAFDATGCASAEIEYDDDDEAKELLGNDDESNSEDSVFTASRNDEILDMRNNDVELMASHANANENNNSNRKRFRPARSGSYEPQNNNNSWAFRQKMRSVQLSSVRASKGRYQGSDIKPYKGRMISKDGSSNVRFKRFGRLDWMSRYSKDIYTTLIDLSWTWIILLTSLVYVGHWMIFGVLYWIFAIANDDYTKIFGSDTSAAVENINSSILETITPSTVTDVFNNEPCVSGVYDFVSAFLFSMESETTIGYGYRNMGVQCKGAIACLVIQCVLSAIFDTWVIGVCYSRIARPDARCNTIMYSKNAVICTRDGKKCLIVRVANLRKSLLLGVSCRARVITLRAPKCKEEKDGHQFMLEQKELKFENASCTMLTAPVEYRHIIDKTSPLYSIPEKCLASEKQNWFEIVTILTGMVEATGMTTHAQTSYLSAEIKYKHRFVPVISISQTKNRYIVDFRRFHETVSEPEHATQIPAGRRKGSGVIHCIEPLVEKGEENDDVFDQEFSNICQFCGQDTFSNQHASQLCVCYKSNGLSAYAKQDIRHKTVEATN